MNLNYEKTMKRILPLHPDSVNAKWSQSTIEIEAEKWCKPFFVIYHRCLDVKIRTDLQNQQCKLTPDLINRCVNDVLEDMHRIIQEKTIT